MILTAMYTGMRKKPSTSSRPSTSACGRARWAHVRFVR
jgi:hypothetical protein